MSCAASRRASGLMMALVAAAGATGVAGAPGSAGAQEVMVATGWSSQPGGGEYAPVSAKELEGYSEILGFDEVQREAATMLLEGYREAVRGAQGARREAMEEARRAFEESQEHETLLEGMTTSTRAFEARTRELEEMFFGDLRSLLMGESQEAQWPRIERARRRAVEIDEGPVSTARVDLVRLAREVAPEWAAGSAAAGILERYELQLDALLVERARAAEAVEARGPGGFDPAHFERMNESIEKQREISLKIRQLNDSAVAEIGAALGAGEAGAALESAYQRAKFPRIYRESHTSRLLAAAAEFEDLTSPQRDGVAALRADYESQSAAVNSRWAREFAKAEASGEESSGAFQVIIRGGGDEEPTDVEKARQARRELDEGVEERLRDILEKAQEERLPKRSQAQDEMLLRAENIRIRLDGG